MEKAAFAAGCFWGVEKDFQDLPGVVSTQVGYSGGIAPNPTYSQVCSGATGHAETVEVTYDPTKISYENLLDAFFSMHDPTSYHRQGPDVGSQYRSIIFYGTPEQEAAAHRKIEELNKQKKFPGPIVTEVAPMEAFYRAEEYHQCYVMKKRNR